MHNITFFVRTQLCFLLVLILGHSPLYRHFCKCQYVEMLKTSTCLLTICILPIQFCQVAYQGSIKLRYSLSASCFYFVLLSMRLLSFLNYQPYSEESFQGAYICCQYIYQTANLCFYNQYNTLVFLRYQDKS